MKKEFLDLGKQPITNSFLNEGEFDNEFLFNLKAVFDDKTKLVSLKEFVAPEMMFNDVYAHRASESYTMRESFKKLAEGFKSLCSDENGSALNKPTAQEFPSASSFERI